MFKPNFVITPKINNKIAKIEKLKTLFDQATILPELEIELRFRATVESVYSSTSIEGNPLNQQQVQKVLKGEIITAPDYAIQEVLNYKNAIIWINQRVNSKKILNYDEILKLHQILMKNLLPLKKVGQLRPGNVYIVDEAANKQIIQYTGPDAKKLSALIQSFLEWVAIQKNEALLHPVLLAGFIHYIFVSIHPFSDGNGRTTRLLTHQYLKTVGYNFSDSLSLDTYYLQHRQSYYQSLNRGKTFDNRMFADVTPFLEFFVEGFLHSAAVISHYIQIGKALDKNTKQIKLNRDELIILDYVYQFNSIVIDEAIKATGATKRTAQRRLRQLVEKKILKTKGKGPATSYELRKRSK